MEDNEKYSEILKGIHKIEITQAVTHEKLSTMESRLEKGNTLYEKIEKRVDAHDKVVGAVALSVLILGTMIKYKII